MTAGGGKLKIQAGISFSRSERLAPGAKNARQASVRSSEITAKHVLGKHRLVLLRQAYFYVRTFVSPGI